MSKGVPPQRDIGGRKWELVSPPAGGGQICGEDKHRGGGSHLRVPSSSLLFINWGAGRRKGIRKHGARRTIPEGAG